MEGQLGSARLLSNVLSVLSFLVTPMFTLGLIHFFLELLHGRKDQSWTAVFSRVKTGLKGLGVELLTLVKMLLWAVPGLCCMGIITYLAMTVDSVSRHGLDVYKRQAAPKYVFMFIGDGMGSPQVSATQYLSLIHI